MERAPERPSGVPMRCMEIRGGSRAVEEAVETPGLDAWVYSRPFGDAERGGDLYYLSRCGGGVITRIIVADVSGHGTPVAEFSETLRNLLRKNINTKSQTGLVRDLNRQFGEMARMRRFATAIVATYLATRQRLTVCNVGHPRPLWYRAATNEWAILDRGIVEAGNLPLGIDDETAYHQFSVPLGQGDLVILYTDALSEASDGSGTMLGEDGLLAIARNLDVASPARVVPAFLEAVDHHRGGRTADDDVTLLALFHNATGPRPPSLREKVDVYAKVFGLKAY